jgi:hypothetical protein
MPVGVRRTRSIPGQSVAHGAGDRPKRETGGTRPCDAYLHQAIIFLVARD